MHFLPQEIFTPPNTFFTPKNVFSTPITCLRQKMYFLVENFYANTFFTPKIFLRLTNVEKMFLRQKCIFSAKTFYRVLFSIEFCWTP